MNRNTRPFLFFGMILLYFLFLSYQILRSDYVMTDAAWSLWHTPDHHTNLDFWIPQGRLLTGYMQEWLFARAGTIANLKYIRLFSCAGWFGCTALLFGILRRLQRHRDIVLDDSVLLVTVAYFAAGFFTLVSISWTVCVEMFVPTFLSLLAGLLLFQQTDGASKRPSVWMMLVILLLGSVSLFFYQTCYPFILLPLYCLYLSRKDGKFTAPMLFGILFFFLVLGIYYLLFRYSLHATGYPPSPRTALKFDPLERLAFFFSPPLNQAFSVNIFFNTGDAFSQALFPVLLVAWLLFEFLYRKGRWLVKLRYVGGLLLWWVLGYLPTLISQETFGPYRSMPVLGTMVLMMIADVVLPLIKAGRPGEILKFSLIVVFLSWGGLVYYAYLARPLREEYRAVRKEVVTRYNTAIRKVVFVCADEDGFLPHYGVRHYKDEFGLPSTYKGWTPEPLVKQIVFELTGDRRQAEKLEVSVYEKASQIPDRKVLSDPAVLFIDAHTLF